MKTVFSALFAAIILSSTCQSAEYYILDTVTVKDVGYTYGEDSKIKRLYFGEDGNLYCVESNGSHSGRLFATAVKPMWIELDKLRREYIVVEKKQKELLERIRKMEVKIDKDTAANH